MPKKETPTNTPPLSFWSNLTRKSFHILLFVTPLLLWPFTSEVFEFNKMVFVYFMTTVITTTWLIDSFQKQRFEIVRTPLDLPIAIFLLSQVASTIFSIDPHTSLWGYYSRFHGGLISTISYIILFYAFITHFKNDPKAILAIAKTIIATATITAVYGVLERLGIDKHIWVQDVQNRVFSTLGQPNWLSAYLIAIFPLSLYLFRSNSKTNYFYLFTSILFLITISFTRSQSGLAATAIILIIMAISWLKKQKKPLLNIAILITFTILLILNQSAITKSLKSLNYINPLNKTSLELAKEENSTRIGGSDSMLIRRIVWEGAIKLGLQNPFFGTGLETFGYSYYWVRPLAHNYTSETDFLYNKAHNEYLNFFATTGFIGLTAYLFLVYSIIKTLFQKSDISISLLLGFISIVITNFIGFSVVNIALFTFLFPAIIISQSQKRTFNLNLPQPNFITYLIVGTASLIVLNKTRNIWLADIYYAKGKSNLIANEQAVKLNPSEPLYSSQLGYLQSLVASQIIYPQLPNLATAEASVKQKATDVLNQYLRNAQNNTRSAVDKNPYNLNLQKNKARAELALSAIDPMFNQEAEKTLLKIIEFSPTDPANYYNLGIFYQSIGKEQKSQQSFQKTLELYPLHQEARNQIATKNP